MGSISGRETRLSERNENTFTLSSYCIVSLLRFPLHCQRNRTKENEKLPETFDRGGDIDHYLDATCYWTTDKT